MKTAKAVACPCGNALYEICCQPLHAGSPALTAEALMRSRYSAFTLELADYVLATWHPATRPPEMTLADEKTQWLSLKVLSAEQQDDAATVEFVARYKINGRAHRLHEISSFVRENARWFYRDGTLLEK